MTDRSHIFYMGEPCTEQEFEPFVEKLSNEGNSCEIVLLPHCDSYEMGELINEASVYSKQSHLYNDSYWTDDHIMAAIIGVLTERTGMNFPMELPNHMEFVDYLRSNYRTNTNQNNNQNLSFWYVSKTTLICIDKLSFYMRDKITNDTNKKDSRTLLPPYFHKYLTKPDFHTVMKIMDNKQIMNYDGDYFDTKLVVEQKHLKQFLYILHQNFLNEFGQNSSISVANDIVENCLIPVRKSTDSFNWFTMGEGSEDHFDSLNSGNRDIDFYKHFYRVEHFQEKKRKTHEAVLKGCNIGDLKFNFAYYMIDCYSNYHIRESYSYLGSLRNKRLDMEGSTPMVTKNSMDFLNLYCNFFLEDEIDHNFVNVISNKLIQSCPERTHISFIYDLFIMPFFNWFEHRFHNNRDRPVEIEHICTLFEAWLREYPYQDNLALIKESDALDRLLKYPEFNNMVNKKKLELNFVERAKE